MRWFRKLLTPEPKSQEPRELTQREKLEQCYKGNHLECSDNGGGMGDAITCHICGYMKYPEVFRGRYTINQHIRDCKVERVHEHIKMRQRVHKLLTEMGQE